MKTKNRVFVPVGIFILFLISCEVILRIRGVTPFVPQVHRVIYEPSFIFAPHSNLGYTLAPGNFKFTLLSLDSMTFHPRHKPNLTRATRPSYLEDSLSRNARVGVFGASYSYGVGVEDSMTYSWMLQEKLINYDVVNYAVPGYGPIHALLLLQGLSERNEMPALVILAYSFYHDNTNTLPRRNRETIARFSNLQNTEFIEKSQVPYCKIGQDGDLIVDHMMYDSFYTDWPLRRYSALVNFLELKYNAWEETRHESQRVSLIILNKIASLCNDNNSEFLLVGITNHDATRDVLSYCEQANIHTLDISLDLNSTDQFRIHPQDKHPNDLAHSKYATRIFQYLVKEDMVSTD